MEINRLLQLTQMVDKGQQFEEYKMYAIQHLEFKELSTGAELPH